VPRLRDVGEFEALRRLTAGLAGHATVIVGPGDDAAVLRPAPGMDLVATTDAFVEGRHYLPEWLAPAGRGARLAAANLSDLAAMAALPRWALLSIGARAEHEVESLLALEQGLERALRAEGAVMVGGNITATEGPEWLSLTLLGEVARGRAWTRHGARPGDLVAASGCPGRAGAGLSLALSLGAGAGAEWQPLLDAWLEPRARLALARMLAATGAVMAATDISDGLLGDLGHLCEASGVGAEVRAEAAATDPLLARAADKLGVSRFDLWVGPSDDYELLLAVDPARRALCEQAAGAAGATLAFIGRFTGARGEIACVEDHGSRRVIGPAGFDHFARG
jgi:thiamine-monophosphate kinase